MSADLRRQLRAYGDVVQAELAPTTVEDIMETRIGQGKVFALEPVRPGPASPPRSGILLAAAAFAVVVGAGLALAATMLRPADVATVPGPPFDDAIEGAESLAGHLSAGDVDGALALFAVGAATDVAGETKRADSQQFAGITTFWVSLDTEFSIASCELVDGRRAECTATSINAIDREAGVPGSELIWMVTLENGLIKTFRIEETLWHQASQDHFVAFNQWVCVNHYDRGTASVWGPPPEGTSYDCTSTDWSWYADVVEPPVLLGLHREYLAER